MFLTYFSGFLWEYDKYYCKRYYLHIIWRIKMTNLEQIKQTLKETNEKKKEQSAAELERAKLAFKHLCKK